MWRFAIAAPQVENVFDEDEWTQSPLSQMLQGCGLFHMDAQYTEHREPDASVLPASGSFCMREAFGVDARYLAMLVEGCQPGMAFETADRVEAA